MRLDLRDDAFVAQDAQVGQRHRRRHRMPGIGEAVGELAAPVEHLDHPVAHHHATHGHVAGGQTLGDWHQIRLQVVVLAAEPFAGAAEAADHLVGDEQNVMPGEDLANARPVAVWRHDDAAGALNRLGDERRDLVVAQRADLFFQLIGHADAEFLGSQRAAFAIPVRLVDVLDARDRQAALGVHALHAAQAGAGHGRAVIAVPAADDYLLLRLPLHRPVMAHHAHHRVVGLGARAGEEHMIHALRRQRGDLLRQLQRRRMGSLEKQVVIG